MKLSVNTDINFD